MDRSTPVPLLTVRALVRRFGRRTVLAGVTFTVDPGERVGIFGGNGAGKSTLLRCVAGTLTPSGGSVRVAGEVAGSLPARRLVGYLPAGDRLSYPRLSAHENLLFAARLRRQERAAQREVGDIEAELDLTSFSDERAGRCSSGQRVRLAFAQVLLASPALLVLDEPYRSLDDQARQLVDAALARRSRIGCLLAAPDDGDLAGCDRTIALSGAHAH